MAASGLYTILTGAEMVAVDAGVVQILNFDDEPLSPTPDLAGNPRPSKTLFSAILSNLAVTVEDFLVKIRLFVPQPLNVADASFDTAPQWYPILSFSPGDTDSSDYSVTLPVLHVVTPPDPITRVLEVQFSTSSGEVVLPTFLVRVDFKHSIY